MKRLFKHFILGLILSATAAAPLSAQFGLGATLTHDFYNRYANPKDDIAHNGNGSVLAGAGSEGEPRDRGLAHR